VHPSLVVFLEKSVLFKCSVKNIKFTKNFSKYSKLDNSKKKETDSH
jgi:hypothetical protein